jgi:hypothetical protein
MNNNLKIHDMPGGIIYIENAFPRAKEFLDAIELENENSDIHSVVPSWSKWVDGYPVSLDPEDLTKWDHVFPDDEHSHRGVHKSFDWDLTINERNTHWPRIEIKEDYSEAHSRAYKLIEMIENDYVELLKIWAEKTNNKMPERITRNYCLRRYRVGGKMGPHIDRNILNPKNTMDWTSLIYLDDDYEGGEIVFDDYGYSIKPGAGSIVFLPCLASHSVNEVLSGKKTYIFLFMHTGTGITTALGEPYHELEEKIVASLNEK